MTSLRSRSAAPLLLGVLLAALPLAPPASAQLFGQHGTAGDGGALRGSSGEGGGGSVEPGAGARRPSERITVASLPQASGNLSLPGLMDQIRAQGVTLDANTILLVGDVGHQMIQQVGPGHEVGGGRWQEFLQNPRGVYAPSVAPEDMALLREWQGRLYAYEHHGPVASYAAKAQGLPNAASMVVRDLPHLETALAETVSRLPEARVVIVVHDFTDADAGMTRKVYQELAERVLEGRTGRPLDPLLEHMATRWAADADMGKLGAPGQRIHQTLEGALEGIQYELEKSGLPREQLARAQVEAANRFLDAVMEAHRARGGGASLSPEVMPELLREAAGREPLFRAGVETARRYGQEVETLKEMARRAGVGKPVAAPDGFEFVKSASYQEISVELLEGGRTTARTLVLEIAKPPISKAAFWTAYGAGGGGPMDMVLIQGQGFVNWFLGAQRGISVKGVTAPWAEAEARPLEGNRKTFEARGWRQNFPAFKGAAYDWAISLGSMENLMDGSRTIHQLGADLAEEGRRLSGEGRPVEGAPRAALDRRLEPSELREVRDALRDAAAERLRDGSPQARAEGRGLHEASRQLEAMMGRRDVTVREVLALEGVRAVESPARRVVEARVREIHERTRETGRSRSVEGREVEGRETRGRSKPRRIFRPRFFR